MDFDDIVVKKKGYGFIGAIIGEAVKLDGQKRVDVESIVPGAEGLIHIYSPDDVRPITQDEMLLLRKRQNAEQLYEALELLVSKITSPHAEVTLGDLESVNKLLELKQ